MAKRASKRKAKQQPDYLADLTVDQRAAVETLQAAIDRGDPACCLQGYAGTGKSFSATRLLKSYAQRRDILLCAPTNKAAAVLRAMAEQIGGNVEATTIHKALGLRPEVDADRGRNILRQVKPPSIEQGALLLVDEASMVDRELMKFILQEVRKVSAQVVYCGDPGQLPPIFEALSPAFAGDMVTARLTTIVRQAEGHPILAMTARIRAAIEGAEVPRFKTQLGEQGSLILMEPAEFETALLAAFRGKDYQSDPDHCRVLAWTNERTNTYNRIIRRSLLGPKADQQGLLPGEVVVACQPILEGRVSIGDHVTVLDATPRQHPETGIPCLLTTINTGKRRLDVWVVKPEGWGQYRAIMGSLAKEANALQRESKARRLTHQEDQQRREAWVRFFKFKDETFADLRPVHASTVHRSQGSTYQTVYVDLSDIGRNTRRDVLLRLLYVALTRARGDVVVTGELPARLYAPPAPVEEDWGFEGDLLLAV